MMCNEKILELLSCHLDGCNTPEQEAALQKHLANCPDCRKVLSEYQKIDAGLATFRCEAPPTFAANVMNAIQADAPQAPKAHKGLPFRYGTIVAAVAAVVLLAISSGRFGNILDGAVSLNAPKAAPEAELEMEDANDAAPEEKSMLTTPIPSAGVLPANVDCQALALAENCVVGVLHAQPEEIAELDDCEYLTLSGGRKYALTQKLLFSLSDRFPSLKLYYPNLELEDDDATAYLILVLPDEE